MKKLLTIGIISSILFGAVGIYHFSVESLDPLSKEAIDDRIQEKYETLYEGHYKIDEEKIRQLENSLMENRVSEELKDVRASYWAEAKEDILGGIAEYVSASPEVVPLLVDFKKIESQQYSSLDDFFIKNYPSSRWIGYEDKLISDCKEWGATEFQCLSAIVISGTESGFDTAYVKNDRTTALDEGRARNDLWGLKANRRYIDAKCGDTKECRANYSSIPYDGFAFVDFNTFDSGVEWFLTDTMMQG